MDDSKPDRPLDLGSLRAAVQAHANAVDVVSSPEFAAADPRWRDTLVAGVVQHVEFTVELCWKMLKRQLEREVPSPSELDGPSYRELFRLGYQRGLIPAVEPWFEFRELRTSPLTPVRVTRLTRWRPVLPRCWHKQTPC